jgi:sugar O-acyltransferase (sialic acid O-acetyltransferase NeuD family)
MSSKILLIGGGGHAKVLINILNNQNLIVDAIVSPEIDQNFDLFKNIKHLKSDSEVFKFDPKDVLLVNGLGSVPSNSVRNSIFEKFCKKSYQFLTIKSESSIVSNFCHLGMGVQIMPGAIINAGARIEDNTIINSGVIIEHDCIIGKSNHIAPGAVICGQACTKENVHVGTGASVIQGITIGENAVIAAGTSVVRDVEKNTLCMPASVSKRPL